MNLRLVLALWLAGMPGVTAVTLQVIPMFIEGQPLPVPAWVVQIASALQSSVMLAVAAICGTLLGPRLGLGAPAFGATARGRPSPGPIRAALLPGMLGGVAGALMLWGFGQLAPAALVALQNRFAMPAATRLLYGGVTEEILVRWGLMSTLAWACWRITQRGSGTPSRRVFWFAILCSALLFGAGHLPAAIGLMGHLAVGVAVYIVVANAGFGVIAGWLFWRFGLEAAIVAHVVTHALLLALP